MSSLRIWKASTLVLAGALAYVVVNDGSASADAQPHMKAALETLKVARSQLEKAASDKGGHRVKAIQLADQTIAEVKAGIEFDNTHQGEKKDAPAEDGAEPAAE